jgi:hypothetical protein
LWRRSEISEFQPNIEAGLKESLSRHQQLWVNQGIRSYQYRLQVNCFCQLEVTDPVIVEVSQGAALSVSYSATGKPAESRYFEKYDKVTESALILSMLS